MPERAAFREGQTSRDISLAARMNVLEQGVRIKGFLEFQVRGGTWTPMNHG